MASMEKHFEEAVQSKDARGAVLLAADVTSKFRYAKVFGTRTLIDGKEKPLALDDIHFIASCTKLLTTIAALQCVERGQLGLHSDLGTVVPELANKEVLTGFDESTGQPQLRKADAPITLSLLLTHQSGFPYEIMNPKTQRYREFKGWKDKSPGTTVPTRNNGPLTFEPGSAWMYGTSVDWAGYVVEQVGGQSLEDYFKEHIFGPLGVEPVTFWPMPGFRDRMVDYNLEDPNGEGLASSLGNRVHLGATACFGGHGGYGTGPSYLAVLESLLRNDGKLVGAEMGEQMCRPHLTLEGKKSLQGLLSSDMGFAWFGQGGRKGSQRDWGYGGLLLEESEPGFNGKNTLTWGGGLNSTWFIDRDAGLCGFAVPTVPVQSDPVKVGAMNEIFKKGVHEEYEAWKAAS